MKELQQKFITILPKWFKAIPHYDKILHAIAGLLIYILFSRFTPNEDLIGVKEFGLLIAFLAGMAKEIYDDRQKGNMGSWKDLFATWSLALLLYYLQANYGILMF